MKSNNPLINKFGYMTIMLGFLISVQLLLIISSENKINNLNNNEKKVFSLNKSKNTVEKKVENTPEKTSLESFSDSLCYTFDIMFRCWLAFFLGGLISERKFIKFGKI